MDTRDIFLNRLGRLRSGWRLAIYGLLLYLSIRLTFTLVWTSLSVLLSHSALPFLSGRWGYLIQGFSLFVPATLVGWACGKFLEDLPLRALGWTFHQGWLKDFFYGTLIGTASLLLATALAAIPGGFRFALSAPLIFATTGKTILVSIPIFIVAAAAEETMFRGYPLQTMARSHLAWVSIIITSIIFSSGHLGNPNVVPGFTFANTTLAGVWLAIAYLRTRNLWFPLGIHWAWNWTMSALVGLPVSGITTITPYPLFQATDQGPAWLTGGAYGIEGGAACTLALLLSTIFIWRTRLVSANEEMLRLTDQENPRSEQEPLPLFERPASEN